MLLLLLLEVHFKVAYRERSENKRLLIKELIG